MNSRLFQQPARQAGRGGFAGSYAPTWRVPIPTDISTHPWMVSSQAMISAPREGDSGTGQSRPFALRFNGNPVRIWSEYLDDQLVSLGLRAFLEPRPPPYLSPENRPVPITCRTSAFHPTPSPENCPAIMSDSFRAPTKLMTKPAVPSEEIAQDVQARNWICCALFLLGWSACGIPTERHQPHRPPIQVGTRHP